MDEKDLKKKGTGETQRSLSNYDDKGNASHYDWRINMSKMIEAIWGTENFMVFCEITAFKYRMRIGKKDNTDLELKKLKWYETMAEYCKMKLRGDTDNVGFGGFSNKVDFPLDKEFLKMLEDDN